MTKENLLKYIEEEYGVVADYPFANGYPIFRHKDNKKWFAALLDIPKCKICTQSNEIVWVLDVKCDPILRPALLERKGIYTVYHMNKEHWISVLLDEASDEDIKFVISMSYDLTKAKYKKKKVENKN